MGRPYGWMVCLALSVLFSACGTDSSGSSGGSTDSQPPTATEISQQVVLTTAQLPKGSKKASKPLLGEACSPVSYFRDYAEAVVASPGFYLPDVEMVQQVGIFRSDGEARKAFTRITSEPALNCVAARMEEASLSIAGSKGTITSKKDSARIASATSRTVSLGLVNNFGQVEVRRIAILDGVGLTTLTAISQAPPLDQAQWRGLSLEAARSLHQAVTDLHP